MAQDWLRKGYASRDSVEVCKQQADLYYTISNPMAPPRPPQKKGHASADTIENVQKKLEREAQQTLQASKTSPASEKLRLLVRFSKIVFMSFVLPPYVIVYALPKFLLTRAIPEAFRFVYRPIHKMAEKIIERYNNTLQRLEKLKGYIFIFKKAPNEPNARTFLQRLTDPFIRIYTQTLNKILAPIRYVQRLPERAVNYVRTVIQTSIDRVKTSFLRVVNKAKEKCLKQFEKVGNFLHNTFVKPVTDWTAPKVKAVVDQFTKTHTKITLTYQKVKTEVKAILKNPTEAVARFKVKAAEAAYKAVAMVSEPTAKFIRTQIKELTAIAIDLRAKAYDLVADRFQLAVQEVKLWVNTSVNAVKQTANYTINALAQGPQKLKVMILAGPAEWLKRGKGWAGQQQQQLKDLVQSNYKKATVALKEGVSRGISELRKAFSRLLNTFIGRIKAAISYVVNTITKAQKAIVDAIHKGVYGLRVGVAWSKVLCRYGMGLVREASQEIVASIAAWIKA